MAAKRWVFFCNGTRNLFFFVTGQIGTKFGQKHQSVSSIEPNSRRILENFPLGWVILPLNRDFGVVLTGLSLPGLQVREHLYDCAKSSVY